MAVSPAVLDATTGQSQLEDIGTLSYNGVTFSQLYRSSVSGPPAMDNAGRTRRGVEWTISVDGVVTLDLTAAAAQDRAGNGTIDDQWELMRQLLSAPAGILTYQGKGFGPFIVNGVGAGAVDDIAWGPKPKLLEFQPLGGSRASFVRWQVTTIIPEFAAGPVGKPVNPTLTMPPSGFGRLIAGDPPLAARAGPVVQFNEESTLRYDEAGYASYSIRGTLEIPLTRSTVDARTIDHTVDDYRQRFLNIWVDLTRFKVQARSFSYSRDKRTCEWEFACTELAPMGLPEGAAVARGNYSVRPLKQGPALCQWLCSLKGTYTIRKDQPRRLAWKAFIGLLVSRISYSTFGEMGLVDTLLPGLLPPRIRLPIAAAIERATRRAWVIHFAFDEGLYDDSRTMTFEASWWLMTNIQTILRASGVWRPVYDPKTGKATDGGTIWMESMEDVMGWRSWEICQIDPAGDVIVDMGL